MSDAEKETKQVAMCRHWQERSIIFPRLLLLTRRQAWSLYHRACHSNTLGALKIVLVKAAAIQ